MLHSCVKKILLFCRASQDKVLETALVVKSELPSNKQNVDLDTALTGNNQNDDFDNVLPSNLNIWEATLNDDLHIARNVSSHEKKSINYKNSSVDSKSYTTNKNSRSQSSDASMSGSTKSDINAVTKIEISMSGNFASVGKHVNTSNCDDNDPNDSDQISSEIFDKLASKLKSSISINEIKSTSQLDLGKETKANIVDNKIIR